MSRTSKDIAHEAVSSKLVKTVHTQLGLFGNRTDIIIVEDGTVRGMSLLECDNPNVSYHSEDSQADLDQLDLFNNL